MAAALGFWLSVEHRAVEFSLDYSTHEPAHVQVGVSPSLIEFFGELVRNPHAQ
jgi:hypothetical protein